MPYDIPIWNCTLRHMTPYPWLSGLVSSMHRHMSSS